MIFKDVRGLILSEKIHQRELGETLSSALNIKSKGRHIDRNSNRSKLNSR